MAAAPALAIRSRFNKVKDFSGLMRVVEMVGRIAAQPWINPLLMGRHHPRPDRTHLDITTLRSQSSTILSCRSQSRFAPVPVASLAEKLCALGHRGGFALVRAELAHLMRTYF